jgi:hypothetical protein
MRAPAKPARARIAIADLVRGKALAKPLTLPSGTPINLTLDTSLNFGELIQQLETEWDEMLHGGSGAVQPAPAPLPTK